MVGLLGDAMSQSEGNGARRRSSRRGGMGQEIEEEGPALRTKVKQLAALVRESKYAVVCVIFMLERMRMPYENFLRMLFDFWQ